MVASLIPFTLQVTATRQASTGQTATYSTAAASGAVGQPDAYGRSRAASRI